jgi:perosamine synthetase
LERHRCRDDPLTGNIDPTLIERYPKNESYYGVHLYGHPVDMDPIMAPQKHHLFVIEDAAEAHGQSIKAKKLVASGILGVLVFMVIK